jgi:hypothetical protein
MKTDTSVIRRRPELVTKWFAMIEGENPEEVIWKAGEFYRALALILAPVDPGRAAKVIERLRRTRQSTRTIVAPMKIDALTYTAWKIPDCPESQQLRTEILDGAISDIRLLEIVLVAQHLGTEDYLVSVIEHDAASGILFFEARALTLVRFAR